MKRCYKAKSLNQKNLSKSPFRQMERREFISSSCKICLLGAAGFSLIQIVGCAPTSPFIKQVLQMVI